MICLFLSADVRVQKYRDVNESEWWKEETLCLVDDSAGENSLLTIPFFSISLSLSYVHDRWWNWHL